MRALVLILALLAAPAAAQDWRFIDALMAQSLDIQPGDDGATLFPDHPDPAVATVAIAFHYFPNRQGGNSIGLNIGLFKRGADGWQFSGPVNGLFGLNPRDVTFTREVIELTTTTLGPNEPRCCPTVATRWSVERADGTVHRLTP